MDLFSEFCNICYKFSDENLNEISEDNMKHLKDALITFVGHADIINRTEIYLCQLCCKELIRLVKFKEMCFNHLIQLRQTYLNMLSKPQFENDIAALKNTLKKYVHEEVLRRNSLDSISSEYLEIVESSEELNTNDSVLNGQVINLQPQWNESEFAGDCSDVSVINNVTACDETRVLFTIEEDMKNAMIRPEEIKSETFKCESDEDYAVSRITTTNVRDISLIFIKEEFDLNNEFEKNDTEHFNLENELGKHANVDDKVPVVNDSENSSVHSGIDTTNEELQVKQDGNALDDFELKITEEEFGDGMNVAFEFANVPTLLNMDDCKHEDRGEEDEVGMKLQTTGCDNKSIASIMNSQQSRPRVRQHRHGRWPRSQKSGVHNRVNLAAKLHMCTVCNKSFRTKRYLNVHKRTHSSDRPYQCTVCNRAFTASSNLIRHKRIHSSDRPYKCTVCNKTFRLSASLISHERTHNGDRPYKCTVCNNSFTTSFTLIVHERIHSGERPYKCSVCNKAFKQSSDLTKHKRIHSGDRPYKCTVCKNGFSSLPNLIVHERIHSGERPYNCTVCNKTFRRSCDLSVHTRIHSGDRPYRCTVCNRAFTASNNLIRHERIHSGDKPYKCTVCNKTFLLSASLISHERTHNGDSPYKCTVCNNTFTTSSSLIVHERIHSGERPYKCSVCNKAFRQSSDLIKHKRIHTGDKPFECNVCNKKFTQSSSLIVHKRKHSGH